MTPMEKALLVIAAIRLTIELVKFIKLMKDSRTAKS